MVPGAVTTRITFSHIGAILSRTYTKDELAKILQDHGKWLRGETSGQRANLYGATLGGATLGGANLYGADLENTSGLARRVLPEEGDFRAFKQVRWTRTAGGAREKAVLVLLVQEYADRVTPYSDRKSRVSHAIPIRAEQLDGTPISEGAFCSIHDADFTYEPGKEASVPNFNGSPFEVCTRGIHVYISRQEAREHG